MLLIVAELMRKVIEVPPPRPRSGVARGATRREPKKADIHVRFNRGPWRLACPLQTCVLSSCDLVTQRLHSVNRGLAQPKLSCSACNPMHVHRPSTAQAEFADSVR